MSIDLRKASRVNYVTNNDKPTMDEIQLGVSQRMADSLERMEKPYLKLIDDLEWYRKRYRDQRDEIKTLNNRISALKGVVTRYKNKLKNL